jgi:MoxR-like ATPase
MSSKSKQKSVSQIVKEIQERSGIVGRTKELRQIVLARLSRRHVVIEGTVGVGKTTLAQAVADYFDQGFIRIDGDERYTEAKLVGHFEPPLVVKNGWTKDSFVAGPLSQAMEKGSVLFINEANRLIEGTQNVLLPALDEGIVTLPKLPPIRSKDGFFVVATQNPESYIGTTVLSEALKDRFVWVKLERQTYDDELEIVVYAAQVKNNLKVAEISTKVCRSTRGHPEIRRGASVRGAIDFAKILNLLDSLEIEGVIEIAIMSLATKIELEDGVERTIEEIISEIVNNVMSGDDEENYY